MATAMMTGLMVALSFSDIEEHRFPVALEMDIEHVAYAVVTGFAARDQSLAPRRLLDDVEDRIVGVRVRLVRKIHAGREADIHAARRKPDIHVRRHRPMTAPADDRAWLHRLEAIEAGLEIRACPTPAAEAGVDRLFVLPVSFMPIAAGCVRLPDLHQHVAGRGAGAVEDAALDDDPFPGCLGRDQHVREVLLE